VSSLVEAAADTFLIALVPSPRLVNEETKLVVEVNSPTIPIPAGPRSIATNFERTIEMIILKASTPPNREVALKI
jgi:hypothetical protein